MLSRAVDIGLQLGGLVAISSDADIEVVCDAVALAASTSIHVKGIRRPAALAQDDTPMRDVVEHVLAQIDGPLDQPIVLLQPTTPLRTVHQVRDALAALTVAADISMTVRAVPMSPDLMLVQQPNGYLSPATTRGHITRRQDGRTGYLRDGTAYVFRRISASYLFNFAELNAVPVVLDSQPHVNCDTPDDWDALCAIIRRQVADR
jgi:N-acylneuraminate cytidylyltransferase